MAVSGLDFGVVKIVRTELRVRLKGNGLRFTLTLRPFSPLHCYFDVTFLVEENFGVFVSSRSQLGLEPFGSLRIRESSHVVQKAEMALPKKTEEVIFLC